MIRITTPSNRLRVTIHRFGSTWQNYYRSAWPRQLRPVINIDKIVATQNQAAKPPSTTSNSAKPSNSTSHLQSIEITYASLLSNLVLYPSRNAPSLLPLTTAPSINPKYPLNIREYECTLTCREQLRKLGEHQQACNQRPNWTSDKKT
jgi:hypothetical protein